MELKAYAKLNLSLEVLERRADGYHNLHSVFQFISLCDNICLEKSEADYFECSVEELNTENNLVIKARDLLRQEYGFGPVSIRLEKQIPTMSGMGGGSADCAAVLKGLNRLFELGLSQQKLMELGARLGGKPFYRRRRGTRERHPDRVRMR